MITIMLALFLFAGISICKETQSAKGVEEMTPEIVEKESFCIAGLKFKGNVNGDNSGIGPLWGKFFERKVELKNQLNPNMGYGYDTWEKNMNETGDFTYIAAVEVKDEKEIPEGMEFVKIPASKYAVFSFEFSKLDGSIIQDIYSKHFPKTGLKMSNNYDFEYYDENFDSENPKSIMHFYIPVE